MQLTASGWAVALLAACSAAAALHSGNNQLYLALAGFGALLVVDVLLGTWNLRNLVARRRLPAEVHAGQPALGSLVLENPRRALPAISILLEELDQTEGRAAAAWLPHGSSVELPASWRFAERGHAQLQGLRIRSSFPFGLSSHLRDLPRPAELLVFPGALGTLGRGTTHIAGSHLAEDDQPANPRRGGTGDFQGLRSYDPGDPIRLIHWPTSARMGKAMVVFRGREADEQVLVELQDEPSSRRWERAICQAAGQVLHHCRLGRAVGLRITHRTWLPRPGPQQRRLLLTALALLPRKPGDAP